MIWCIDSPGFGGSEIDFLERSNYLVKDNDVIILSENVNPVLNQKLKKLNVLILYKREGNNWKFFYSSLIFFLKNCRKYKKNIFIVWAHHLDSNRWLQLFFALFKFKFYIVERALPSNNDFLRKTKLLLPLKKFIAKRACETIICAHSHKQNYNKLFSPYKLTVIVNSRNINEISKKVDGYRKKIEKDNREFRIIAMTGRICHEKDQQSIIRAISMIHDKSRYKLLLIGEGVIEEQLKKEAAELQVNLEISGFVKEPLKLMAGADVFVFSSLSEGLPGSLIEAMAAKLPCIATDIPGNNELIKNRETGLLVHISSPYEIKNSIYEIFDNHEATKAYVENAFNHVLKNYDQILERSAWKEIFLV